MYTMAAAVLPYMHQNYPSKRRNWFTIKSLLWGKHNNFILNTNRGGTEGRRKKGRGGEGWGGGKPAQKPGSKKSRCVVMPRRMNGKWNFKGKTAVSGIQLPGASVQSESVKGERRSSSPHRAKTLKPGRHQITQALEALSRFWHQTNFKRD